MKALIWMTLLGMALMMVSCDKCEAPTVCTLDDATPPPPAIADVLDDRMLNWENSSYFTKEVLEPLVEDSNCSYYLAGKVKYTGPNNFEAIIDYGNGAVDAWAVVSIRSEATGTTLDANDNFLWSETAEQYECYKIEQECVRGSSTSTALSRAN